MPPAESPVALPEFPMANATSAAAAHNATLAVEPGMLAGPEEASPETSEEEAAEPAQAPVIEFNKALPEAGEHAVRGRVTNREPVDTTGLYGSPEHRRDPSLPLPAARGEDPMIRLSFVADLARYLADSYWPAGTHPAAKDHGITTAGVKWTNLTFGGSLRGFGVSRDSGAIGRAKVLAYALNSEMLNALYTMYGKRFFQAMAKARSGADGRPALTPAQRAEMYALYAVQARALAGTIRAYCLADGLERTMAAYSDAENVAADAYERLLMHSADDATRVELQREYQRAIIRREQARELLASSLRRAGNTGGMDTDSLVYVASWLARRGPGKGAAFQTLADILDRVAGQFDAERPVVQ